MNSNQLVGAPNRTAMTPYAGLFTANPVVTIYAG